MKSLNIKAKDQKIKLSTKNLNYYKKSQLKTLYHTKKKKIAERRADYYKQRNILHQIKQEVHGPHRSPEKPVYIYHEIGPVALKKIFKFC